ncbi:hypothetical protein M8J75_007316 [Diaphorina citri]|nr:hypothetical protein M8J75_007316 [Diaphorina citri]KAI5728620.1 hypothetical protein M8J77_018694 [Diaphorina citri]
MYDLTSAGRRSYGKGIVLSHCLLSLSYLLPGLLLPMHIYILYYFWFDYGREVDKHLCSCSCWDTVFKGSYESGVATYKHVYFNATQNAFKMWLLTIVFIIVLYESMKLLIWLAFQWKLRVSMCVLFLASLFPHYYTWWCYMNYYNDEYYKQWYHQLFFSFTEIVSSFTILYLCSTTHETTVYKLSVIIGIALVHVCVSSVDQFVSNVLQGEGYSHQVVRDLGFMIPDLLNIALPLLELHKLRSSSSLFKSPGPTFSSGADPTLPVIINASVILSLTVTALALL